ncbi:MAG TPA: protease pro-enzyme activation domain-containing protein, partial [Acidobacteriaceae bacterium]
MRCTSLPRFTFSFAALIVVLALASVPASSAVVANRISAQPSNENETGIPNSVHPHARAATDLGPAPSDTRLQGMTIRFSMTATQEAALDQLLDDLQNPSSPRYHQWLTPAEYGAQFGLSSADLGKVTAWLASQGFTVTDVAQSNNVITFDGTAAQVQAAFATSIHTVSYKGETHFANLTDASVPAAFANVVMGVTGLHDFRLKPRLVKPQFTSSVSGNHFIAPGDVYAIYNMNALLTSGITGAGQTIAVIGQVDINTADVVAFRTAAGLITTNVPTTTHVGGDPGPALSCTNCHPTVGDLAESSLDVEWSGAMAPSASILFVNGPDVFNNAMTGAVTQNLAPIITSSYGACEAGWGTTDLNTLNTIFKQANAQGQTILTSSGDQGAADCDAGSSAIEGLAADFPGSSPYVTSMGGTQFNDGMATGATTYWNSPDTTFTAGSAIPSADVSAKGYVPESVWNDASVGGASGGGGGASAYFTKPAWQKGTGVPSDSARDVPDISLTASDSHDSLLYCYNVALGTSCTTGFRIANNNLTAAGGTSFDSQIFGGILALVEQKIGSKIGNANPTIYALANSPAFYSAGQTIATLSTVVFNDITSGSNQVACTAGTPNCPNGGSLGYTAGNGYDLASGWGSVNVTNMANAWKSVTPLGVGSLGANISATTLTATPSSAAVGATVTLTATVTGSAGTPTGTVQFLANNVALGSAVTLSSGVATYSWVTSCTNLGQQVMSAAYSGDANYQGSTGPVLTAGGSTTTSNGSFTVTPVEVQVTSSTCADFSLTAATPSVSVAAGATIPTATITATPTNNFTGTVVFTTTFTSTSGYAPTLTFSPAS